MSTRVASDRERVERAVDLMYRCLDRFTRGADYDDLLNGQVHDEKLDPRVFVALGFLILWAGGRPRLFRRLLQRARLSADFGTVSAIVWTAWASMHPSSLRGFMRLMRLARNALTPSTLTAEDAVAWSPGRGVDPMAISTAEGEPVGG